ncbi:DUF373 family protein [Candidatus Micrarchaeota archaeon]|nr:DUF373 family protein [Candidatus Micrarchaeota archaeon]
MVKKSKLVLCIDRDNDLYEKAKISGPVIGREANFEAANKLIMADASEVDANAMFRAVKLYDELLKEYNVQIATLTGNAKLGIAADNEVSEQLERVLAEFPAESCIFVSDGASDEQMMPIIRSRLKIDSVDLLVIKQAKELEKTYVVLLDKLKDPYFARLFFGVPAIILLLLAVSRWMELGWEPVVFIVGLFLLIRGFGIDDKVSGVFSSFKFSIENISLSIYLLAFVFFIISIGIGYQGYEQARAERLDLVKTIAAAMRSTLLLLPWSVLLLIIGRTVDLLNDGRKLEISKFGLYAVSTVLLWLILSVATDWVLNTGEPYVSFGDFAFVIVASVVFAALSSHVLRLIKISVVGKMKLENKEMFTDTGVYMGKVIGVDAKNSAIVVRSPLGQKFNVGLDIVNAVTDRIYVSYG